MAQSKKPKKTTAKKTAAKKRTPAKKRAPAKKKAPARSGLRVNSSASPLLVKFCSSLPEPFKVESDLKGSWQGPLLEKVRAYTLCDGLIRKVIPLVLSAEGHSSQASALSDTPEVNEANAEVAVWAIQAAYDSLETVGGRDTEATNAVYLAGMALNYTLRLSDKHGLSNEYQRIGYTAARCIDHAAHTTAAARGAAEGELSPEFVWPVAEALRSILDALTTADDKAAVIEATIEAAAEATAEAAPPRADYVPEHYDYDEHSPPASRLDLEDTGPSREQLSLGLDDRAANPRHRYGRRSNPGHRYGRHSNPGMPIPPQYRLYELADTHDQFTYVLIDVENLEEGSYGDDVYAYWAIDEAGIGRCAPFTVPVSAGMPPGRRIHNTSELNSSLRSIVEELCALDRIPNPGPGRRRGHAHGRRSNPGSGHEDWHALKARVRSMTAEDHRREAEREAPEDWHALKARFRSMTAEDHRREAAREDLLSRSGSQLGALRRRYGGR